MSIGIFGQVSGDPDVGVLVAFNLEGVDYIQDSVHHLLFTTSNADLLHQFLGQHLLDHCQVLLCQFQFLVQVAQDVVLFHPKPNDRPWFRRLVF